MAEEIDFETYLSLTKNKFEIFLFDKTNLKNLYKDELKLENTFNFLDLDKLNKFLDNQIFKIEKIYGKFIKNIYLILENDLNLEVNICIKKKNYGNLINKKSLENALIEVKDLFKESYQQQTIIHMIINNYLINDKNYSSFIDNLRGDNLCLEINFKSISNDILVKFDKILEKYQITISQYFNRNYVKDLFKESYQHQTITHMIISNYLINGKNYSSFIDNLRGDNLCLEINFMSISNSTIFVFDKTLEKYQIRISQYLNGNYIKSFFNDQNIELSEMANKLRNGYNHNEVILVPKNIVNKGFFEKFFQLFS